MLNILGTSYNVEYRTRQEDETLKDCDGYCDKTTKLIVVRKEDKEIDDVGNFLDYQKKVLRHEIVHAFLDESGLQENFEHPNRWGHEEIMIDWIAIQGLKLYQAWRDADAI